MTTEQIDDALVAIREARAVLALCIASARTLGELQTDVLADLLAGAQAHIERAADILSGTSRGTASLA